MEDLPRLQCSNYLRTTKNYIVGTSKTFLKIERHASNVYTRFLFELVQKEIFVGLWHFQIDSISVVEGSEVCIIKESSYVYEMPKKKKKSQSMDKGKDKDKEDDTVNMFFKKMEFISVDHCVIFDWSKMSQGLDAFVEKLKLLKKEVEADLPNPLSKNKTDNLEQLVGVAKPPVVNVNNPSVGTTKGRQKLRIKGGKEKAIEKVLKGMNLCSMCGGYDNTMRESEDGLKVKRSCGSKEVLSQWEVGQLSIAGHYFISEFNYIFIFMLRYEDSRLRGELGFHL
ncbi:hypothetical protein Tco_0534843 [Tanacetum coccineum]